MVPVYLQNDGLFYILGVMGGMGYLKRKAQVRYDCLLDLVESLSFLMPACSVAV